jgi:hypothetical protein
LSFKVLVVPEDSTNNGYILGPLVEKMLAKCGKPRAQVEVLGDPRVMGYEHAKKLLKNQILEQYRFTDLILFLPDADGKGESRSAELLALEDEAGRQRVRLLCCAAQQEVEVWLMAGHRRLLGRPWPEIRNDASIKEAVFERFLAVYGNLRASGDGRESLMLETLKGYDALLQLCPELEDLERRIREILA